MNKDLLGLKDLSADEITAILDNAVQMKQILNQNVKKTPHLQGKSVTTLFYENSTRTRMSFETAAKILGATVSGVSVATSSVIKGETLIDTGRNLDALLTDVIILRHSMSGAPHVLARKVKASVVNAGDGTNEHPTQALLDIFTMREHFGSDLRGLKVVLSGDIRFSRVARSNLLGLNKLGAVVTVVAPYTLIPAGIEAMGCTVEPNLSKAVEGANVIMGLRMQTERQSSGMFPSIAEYSHFFCITEEHIKKAAADIIIMHPGPINRGVEMTSEVADSPASVILQQVTNGVAVRMAVLFMLTRER
jgi:aspartate carbamoyltransferase catalytic subunit